MTRRSQKNCAFSIIELLVVITVIGTLIAITLPTLASVRRSSRRLVCATQLRSLGVALRSYMDTENHGYLPVGGSYYTWDADRTRSLRTIQDYLSSSRLGRKENGLYVRNPPFTCPSDELYWPQHGYSFDYIAGMWMTDLLTFTANERLARMATFRVESGDVQGQPVFRELNFLGHTAGLRGIAGTNELLIDGAVQWKGWVMENADPPMLYRPFDP